MCVRLAFIICVLWFRSYLLVLVHIIGRICGGVFLWKEYVSLWLMFFVWDIDFILFCSVVFVGFVICFLGLWYKSLFLFCISWFYFFGLLWVLLCGDIYFYVG